MFSKQPIVDLPVFRKVLFEKTNRRFQKFLKTIECHDSVMEVHPYETIHADGYIVCHFFPLLSEHEFGKESKLIICRFSFIKKGIVMNKRHNDKQFKENISTISQSFWPSTHSPISPKIFGLVSQFVSIPDTDKSKEIALKLFARMANSYIAYNNSEGPKPQTNMFITTNFPILTMLSRFTRNYNDYFVSQQKHGVKLIISKNFKIFEHNSDILLKFKKRVSSYLENEHDERN